MLETEETKDVLDGEREKIQEINSKLAEVNSEQTESSYSNKSDFVKYPAAGAALGLAAASTAASYPVATIAVTGTASGAYALHNAAKLYRIEKNS